MFSAARSCAGRVPERSSSAQRRRAGHDSGKLTGQRGSSAGESPTLGERRPRGRFVREGQLDLPLGATLRGARHVEVDQRAGASVQSTLLEVGQAATISRSNARVPRAREPGGDNEGLTDARRQLLARLETLARRVGEPDAAAMRLPRWPAISISCEMPISRS